MRQQPGRVAVGGKSHGDFVMVLEEAT